ncbi:MAG: YihY/virulence factor BrkB family protein [Pelatocladus maniniholoensis HA4357-MV3]|jgi:membrane protein|uniref:YihY/virulence factor BrkB family protein n=1 Tax=Pelatocladus maniniholoensis HA4357-MV3 TaxID=1117104 RepID=A0A9E3LSE6_9NOST|nr:YihY/virulence factor BrkB family protein [Pelatocladus maniniholoensis HA4357-MV3]
MNFKLILGLFKETFNEWQEDKASRLAAALAYYTIFSIAPLLIIVIAIAGAVFGEAAARNAIFDQLQGLIGAAGAEVIQNAIESASQPRAGTVASLISIVVLIFGATSLFTELQDSLNTIWEVKPKPGKVVKNMVRQRFLSFAMVLAIGFLLLVSLVISTILAALINYFQTLLPGVDFLWQIVNFTLGFIITTLLFGLIFKVLPDAKIVWKDVLIGAALTSLLFSFGRYALGQYLGNNTFGSTYGAAGSIVVILVWVYYTAQILFFGAEFTQVYARRYGSCIIPADYAVSLKEISKDDKRKHRRGG